MTVGKTQNNPYISNISFYSGTYTPPVKPLQRTDYVVHGNPNRPEVLNDNPDAGVVRTFDSRRCFGYELT